MKKRNLILITACISIAFTLLIASAQGWRNGRSDHRSYNVDPTYVPDPDKADGRPTVCQLTIYSQQFALNDGQPFAATIHHNFGAPPKYLRAVMLCLVDDPDAGISAGTELEAWQVFDSENLSSPFGVYSDVNNISVFGIAVGGSQCIIIINGVSKSFTSMTNYALKVYYAQ